MSPFYKVFKLYNKSFRGAIYMPLRWAIVPFAKIESSLPKAGLVIDLGCGEGVMATTLAVNAPKRTVVGLDTNIKKIELAKAITKNIANLSFKTKDALSPLPKAKGFVLSDFLHHLPKEKHAQLFTNIHKSLSSGGIMVIKEIDTQKKIRSRVSRSFDFIFYPKDKINFLSSKNLVTTLKKIGFQVKASNEKRWFPGSTTIYICTKQ